MGDKYTPIILALIIAGLLMLLASLAIYARKGCISCQVAIALLTTGTLNGEDRD